MSALRNSPEHDAAWQQNWQNKGTQGKNDAFGKRSARDAPARERPGKMKISSKDLTKSIVLRQINDCGGLQVKLVVQTFQFFVDESFEKSIAK